MTQDRELALHGVLDMPLLKFSRLWFYPVIFVLITPFVVSAEEPAASHLDEIIFLGGVSGIFDQEKNPTLALEYRLGRELVTLRPWLGVGWATDGAVFAGGGLLHSWRLSGAWAFTVGFGAGRYDRHEGRDLGSHLEFLSYGEFSRKIGRGRGVLMRLSHISNGSLADINPGTELLTIGYSISLP